MNKQKKAPNMSNLKYTRRPGLEVFSNMLYLFFMRVALFFKPRVERMKFVNGSKNFEVHFECEGIFKTYEFEEFILTSYFHTLPPTDIKALYNAKIKYDDIHSKYSLIQRGSIEALFCVHDLNSGAKEDMFALEILKDKEIVSNLSEDDLYKLSRSIKNLLKKDSKANLRII